MNRLPPNLVAIMERALDLPQGVVERDTEWATATPGDGPRWSHDQLAEAYLMAGLDRHRLLQRLGLIRDDAR